jgi:hypothetical protein
MLSHLPQAAPDAKAVVRWNPTVKRYQLVVGSRVLAEISRLGMSLRSERAKFRASAVAVNEVIRLKRPNAEGQA